MKKFNLFFVLTILLFLCNRLVTPAFSVENEEISEEDREIIQNLDLLESMDLLTEDLGLFEDYQDIEQTESTGESYE